jgi:hypothetical protein
VLLLVAAPAEGDVAQAVLELALDAPGTQIDSNHVYRVELAVPVSDSGEGDAAR